MAGVNITEVRQGLKAAIQRVYPGLKVYEYVIDNPDPPCAQIYPELVDYKQSFDGTSFGTFIVMLLAPGVDDESGQRRLDQWLESEGPNSVVQVLQDDSTLGGTVGSAGLTQVRNYGVRVLGEGQRYYAAELVVDVIA